MNRIESVIRLMALVAVGLTVELHGLAATAQAADEFPDRPIRVIAPVPPGGITDVIVRLVSEKLNAKWNQPLVLENRPGGNGMIGVAAVTSSRADGYTLLFNNAIGQNRLIFKTFTADLVNDLEPIVEAVRTPIYLVARANAAFKNLRDMVNYAKANPGKLNVGTSLVLQMDTTIMFNSMGLNVTYVPYPGSGSLPAALMSESVDVIYVSLPPIRGFLSDGRARALAVASVGRTSITPDVPAIGELYPGVVPIDVLSGFWAPKGTPKPILTKLNSEINAILKLPDVVERLSSGGMEVRGGTPEAWKAAQEELFEKFRRATDTMGLQKQ